MMQEQNKRILSLNSRDLKVLVFMFAVVCSAVLTAYLITLCPRMNTDSWTAELFE